METKEDIQKQIDSVQAELARPYKNDKWYASQKSLLEYLFEQRAILSRPKKPFRKFR